MILLTIFISTWIARKKAKSNSENAIAVSFANTDSVKTGKPKTGLDNYAEWLKNQELSNLRAITGKKW